MRMKAEESLLMMNSRSLIRSRIHRTRRSLEFLMETIAKIRFSPGNLTFNDLLIILYHPNISNLYIIILPNKSLAFVNSTLTPSTSTPSPRFMVYSKLLSGTSHLVISFPSAYTTTSRGQNPPWPMYLIALMTVSASNLTVICCGKPWSEFQQVASWSSKRCFFPNCLWSFWRTEETEAV